MNKINWERVASALERAQHRMIWRPYGFPNIGSPITSAFVDGAIQPPWKVPEKMLVSTAITGAFMTREDNPAQPITVSDIREQAAECAANGSSTVHIHVRDDRGYNTLSLERFENVITPLRDQFPDLAVDGCLVAALDGEWEEMKRVLNARLLDAVPINTTATYIGDALFAKPIPVILEKTRLVQESGAKVIVACYVDGDVSNADRLLFRSGLVSKPSSWIILPALPGCSPMENPRQMADGLLRISSAIFDVDPSAIVTVCAAGRASTWLVTLAAILGLHIRVGMEDTVWRWPHREEKIAANIVMLQAAKDIAALLGRSIATHSEYREIMGMPARNAAAAR